ncbi:MAG: ribonuclease III [Candidatus Faecisoma sp.]|jgi:ribonuclease-3|nr:ribonuclease III [Acholeplasma sp.]MCI5677424.1 ribonuclease III [Acholeplasma sp.]MDY2892337.1 ribonuclease III [Candidatus Faecisoma sp.]
MKILEEFGITPNKIKLYEQALTHTSYANEHNCPSYERLEYLGDAVLELVMSTYLFKNTTYPEGRMTKLRASYVCENALYEYSLKLGLNEYIRLGHGESENGGRMRKAIVADTFEAFIAAMYLDQGLDVVNNFIKHYIIPLIEKKELNFEQDYKSILQEFVQTDKRTLNYVVVDESGPAHDKTFTIIVKIDDIIYGRGTAHSKKEAEQLAAKNALEKAQNS